MLILLGLCPDSYIFYLALLDPPVCQPTHLSVYSYFFLKNLKLYPPPWPDWPNRKAFPWGTQFSLFLPLRRNILQNCFGQKVTSLDNIAIFPLWFPFTCWTRCLLDSLLRSLKVTFLNNSEFTFHFWSIATSLNLFSFMKCKLYFETLSQEGEWNVKENNSTGFYKACCQQCQ